MRPTWLYPEETKVNNKLRGFHGESDISNASGKYCETTAQKIVLNRKKL